MNAVKVLLPGLLLLAATAQWAPLSPPQAEVLNIPVPFYQIDNDFTTSVGDQVRFALATWLSADQAFQLAASHVIAQWFGFASIPGFSEEVSAFMPEDLYSNLLEARITVSLIHHGHTTTEDAYIWAMDSALPQVPGAQPADITRFRSDMLDGFWWDSMRQVPEKYPVLLRNYDVADDRLPTPEPGERAKLWHQSLPLSWQVYDLDAEAERNSGQAAAWRDWRYLPATEWQKQSNTGSEPEMPKVPISLIHGF